MKRGRKAKGLDAASKRLHDLARAAFAANQDVKRCKTPFCGAAGECLACGADQGVACQASLYGGDDAR
jgi:hypothetical protein